MITKKILSQKLPNYCFSVDYFFRNADLSLNCELVI